MYVGGIIWFKYKLLTSSCLMFLFARFILIVDSVKPENPLASRQMCTKLQSMLSYGKYQTSQMSSNITYVSRLYAQNFLAYSSIDDLLIFIEPKHQIHVYNAQKVQLLVNLSTTDVVIATSTTSLLSDSHRNLFFIYQTNSKTNLISLRVCQVSFNISKLIFEDNYCIETLTIQYDQPNLRLYGFTIKRDHAETTKSLLFISTEIGLIYTIFDTHTGSLIGESTIMNETLNEGSIVISSSGSIYYASKQEHLIYELHIGRDFRLYYGKIIKTNAIKYPFGLITDECNHLYIATRSMILIMFVQTRATIRSVFSKASDLPTILERLNSTTYVYATMKKNAEKTPSNWMFNFLYFTDPERLIPVTRHPVVSWEEKMDFNDTANIPILWPLIYSLPSTMNGTKKYTQFSFTARKPFSQFRKKMTKQQTATTISIDQQMSSMEINKLFTPNPSIEESISDLTDDFESDDNSQLDLQDQINQPLDNEDQSETDALPSNSPESIIPVDDLQNESKGQRKNLTLNQEFDFTTSSIQHTNLPSNFETEGNSSFIDDDVIRDYLEKQLLFDAKSVNQTIDIAGIILSKDDVQSYLEGRGNLSSRQKTQIQAYLAKQSSSDYNIFSRYSTSTRKSTEVLIHENEVDDPLFPIKFKSTIDPRFSQTTPKQSLSTNLENIPLDKTSKPALPYSVASDIELTPFDFVVVSADNTTNTTSLSLVTDPSDTQLAVDQTEISSSEINDTIIPSIQQQITSLQNQSNLTDTSRSYDSVRDRLDDVVSLTTISDYVSNKKIEDEISHEHSSLTSPFITSRTTLLPSRLSSPLHRSLTSPSTKSRKSSRISPSKLFSESIKTTATTFLSSEETSIDSKSTTMLSYSTIFPSSTNKLQSSDQFSTMQTTDTAITSDIPKQKPITTLADMSPSSQFTTHHPRFTSTLSSTSLFTTDEQSLTTESDQFTSNFRETHVETSSLPDAQSTEMFTTNYQSISTNLDASSTIMSDKTSSHSTITITDKENLARSDYQPLETTETLPLSTDKYQEGFISTEPTLKFASTTSVQRHRTRKYKTTRQTQQLSTTSSSITTTLPSYQTTSITDNEFPASTQISIWHSEWNLGEKQETTVTKPSLTKNDSHTYLSDDFLNRLFNNISTSSNSSSEKFIHFNLTDLPPSSWNLSLNSNESIALDITLPSSNLNKTTNLTFTNITANRFSTKIIGSPINLQVDSVQTKQFSLIMDATDNDFNPNRTTHHLSDITIGHVRSEQFELNLTKSDNMHIHVQQVDSATADLYLDNHFCTNESSLEINLNLSKNGTIRYGNRTPILIGPVFTRVHMLKQSCDRDQPLSLFFDICERQNPCSNGGTCLSILPDYNDKSYIYTETGHIGYRCQCPLHISGEHCQNLQYPLGYCLNDGTYFQIYDRFNKSIEQCFCPIGFHGQHCEENIDNCIGITCSGHGMCEDGIERYKCLCYDGFYGFNCERANVQTVLLRAASRSFGIVAILLIASIASLVVASDIHTYLTRKQQKNSLLNRIPRVTSELFENSVLLLGFSDAPIEMNDLSNAGTRNKPIILKPRPRKKTTRYRRQGGYRQLSRRRPLTTYSRISSRRFII